MLSFSCSRKGRQTEITSREKGEKLNNFVRGYLGIHFLQKVRGSQAYFNKMFYGLLGMIRQFCPCTWFLTLSEWISNGQHNECH